MAYQKSIETREKITEVAKELFYNQGYKLTTIRQITKKAELLNQGTFYYYFESKIDLVIFFIDEFITNIVELIKENNINHKDYLFVFACIQIIKLNEFILNDQVRRFYSEIEGELNHQLLQNASILYTNLFINLAHEYNPNVDDNHINFYINSYAATIGKTISNIENNTLNITLDESIHFLKIFYPRLLEIDHNIIEEKYKMAEITIKGIRNEKLKTIKLLL